MFEYNIYLYFIYNLALSLWRGINIKESFIGKKYIFIQYFIKQHTHVRVYVSYQIYLKL